MIDVFKEGLFRVTKKYGNIVMLYGDEGVFPVGNFFQFFADRSFNLGLGRQNLVSAACGFIVRGKLPIILGESSLAFAATAQIRDNICIPNLNVKFVVAGSNSGSNDFSDMEIIKSMPNIKVMCPKNDEEMLIDLEEMVGTYRPVYFRLM